MRGDLTSRLLLYFELTALAVLSIGITFAHSSEYVFANETAKFYLLLKGLALVLLFRLIRLVADPGSNGIRVTRADFLLAVTVLYIVLNRFFVAGIEGYTMSFYELIGLSLLYLLIRSLPVSTFPVLLLIICAAGLIQAVYGNLQLFGVYPSHHTRFSLTGGFFNPGPYAGYLTSVLPAALALWLFRSDLFRAEPWPVSAAVAWLGLAVAATIVVVLPATESRAGWIAAALSAGYLLWIRFRPGDRIMRVLNTPLKQTAAGAAVLLLTGGAAAGIYQINEASADGRLLIWTVTAEMARDKPLFGHGVERFPAEYMNYQAAWFEGNPGSPMEQVAGDVRYAFNEVLELAAETGLAGLIFSGILLLVLIAPGRRLSAPSVRGHAKVSRIAARAGFVSIFLFGLFSYPSSILPIKVNAVIFVAILASLDRPLFRFRGFPDGQRRIVVWVVAILSLVAGFSVVRPQLEALHTAHLDWREGHRMYSVHSYERSLERYEAALPLLSSDGDFMLYYGRALYAAGRYDEALDVLERARRLRSSIVLYTNLGNAHKALGHYEEAEEAYLHAYRMARRFYPLYLLARHYEEAGRTEEAVQMANELLRKQVKVPSRAIDEMRSEMEALIESAREAEHPAGTQEGES